MALTTKQKINLFTILEVPYSDGEYFTVTGMGTLGAQTNVGTGSQNAAKTQIESWLTAMALTSEVEDELQTALDLYEEIKFCPVKIEGGNFGDVGGVTFTTAERISMITQQVKILVPFFRHHEIIAKQLGNSPNVMISR